MRSQVLTICFVLFVCGTVRADTPEFPAEKFRKALEQNKELEVSGQPLGQAVQTLAHQTSIPLQLDPVLKSAGVFSLPSPTLTVRPVRQTVAAVLDRELAAHGFTYVVLADKVLITTPERAAHLALRQKVRVDLKAVSLARALDRLARETGVTIVLDPQAAKESETVLTMRLTDVTLEVAVRMLAASAGLHSVRLDNVLFVTKPSKAQVLIADAADLRTPLPPAINPLSVPGGMLGLAGGGLLGQLSGGLGGGHGALGLGGGALGVGGGQFGIGGALGIMGGGALGQPPQNTPPPKPPKKAPDGEKKQGPGAGPAQGKASSPPGVLVAAQGPVQLTELSARSVKAAPAPAVGKHNGNNRQFKTLLDVLTIPRDARGNPTEFDEQGDPSLTLGRMFSALESKFSRPGDNPPFYLRFDLDTKAFEAEGVKKKPPEELGLGIEKAKIPAEKNISLLGYLRKILQRVEGAPSSGLTFVIGWDNRIEITTNQRLLKEFYGKRSKAELKGPLPPLVHAVFEARPLDEALRELSDATDGYNVLLNGNVKEAKVPMTATFRNVPLDTAVWALADMAGLTVVRKDNLLYVTSKEPARPLPGPAAPKKLPSEEKK
ncbi:MAG: hypothetical protein HYS12_23985 [Planctomycetes bacterium]|nr:hypothetical protein [Planctomycetota bacterium]